MRRALLIALLALTLIAATPQADVAIQAPDTAIPGETVSISVETSIEGVRVISVPLEVTVTWPDAETTTLETTPDQEGVYHASLYAPQQGTYTVTAQASVADTTFEETKDITVQKPHLPVNISANQTHIRIQGEQERTYQVRLTQPEAGPLTDRAVACTITCATCAQACPVQDGLAYVTTNDTYDYSWLLSTQEPGNRLVEQGQALDTAGWYQLRDDALISLPASTVFTQPQTLVTPDARIIDVRVQDDDATHVDTDVAYDAQTGSWYARYTGNQTGTLRANHTILQAWDLAGNPLVHNDRRVITDNGFEARIRHQKQAPPLPEIQTTQYGETVSVATDHHLRLRGTDAYILSSGQALLQTHTTPQATTVYYADADHIRLDGPALREDYRPAYTQQEVALDAPNNTRLTRILDAQLQSVFAQEGAPQTWTPQLPPGKYFVRYQTPNQTYTEPIELLREGQAITAGRNRTHTAQPNTQLRLTRTIRNTDTQPRTIDVSMTSEYRVLLEDADARRLTDTDLDGVPDTGVLAPGESVEIHATVLLPPEASSSRVVWDLSTQDAQLSLADEITVVSAQALTQQEDLAISRITPGEEAITIEVFNRDDQPHTTRLQLAYTTTDGDDASQHSITAPPGASNQTYTLPPRTTQVRAELEIDDEDPDNNVRYARTSTQAGRSVLVSEPRGQDHEAYRVKAVVPAGEWSAQYPLANGSWQQAPTAALSESAGEQELLVEFPLAARTDLQVALTRGSGPTLDPYQVIDNREADTRGRWISASQVPGFLGADYLTDLDSAKGEKFVDYAPDQEGSYEVEITYPGDAAFASNTRVVVGETTVLVDQRQPAQNKYLGRYRLGPDAPVSISNAASDGMVVADAIRLLRVDAYGESTEVQSPSQRPSEGKPLIYDSRGNEVSASVGLSRAGQVRKSGLRPGQARANDEEYEIEFTFERGPVDSLRVHRANPANMSVGLERVTNARAQQFTSRNVGAAFAINPEFSSNYSFTRVATGRELLKCTDYDFDTQTCNGEFVSVMQLTPGQRYTATLDPRDPLLIEVTDETVPPVEALCSIGGGYSASNCDGTYDTEPACGDELIWCDDTDVEQWTTGRDNTVGIDSRYADVDRDPAEQCDTVQAVDIYYDLWESGDDGLLYTLEVSADNGSTWSQVQGSQAVPNTQGAPASDDVSGLASWVCGDFFGDSSEARARITAVRSGGNPDNSYVLNVDYLVFRIDYNFTQFPLETDKTSYVQAEEIEITGSDIWDAGADVTINITKDGSFVDQVNATANGTGEFNVLYIIENYAETGVYDLYGWQDNDSTINASGNYTVNTRSPTIGTQRAGDFFNRTETVVFSGDKWGRGVNVTVNGTGVEEEALELTPAYNMTDSNGTLTYTWQTPSELSSLTGPYSFTFTEVPDNSYNASKTITLVVLPSYAQNVDAQDELNDAYVRDNTYASFVDNNGGLEWIEMRYPDTIPEGVNLTNMSVHFFHREGTNAQTHDLEWYNPGTASWELLCNPPLTDSAQWDQCDLTSRVDQADYYNQVRVRWTDSGTDAWPQTPPFEYDIAYLDVNFTYPPPDVTALAPANNSWFSTDTQTLSYNATTAVFGIQECSVRIDGTVEYTNTSFANPGTDSYTHTFTEGNHTWGAECLDDSARSLTGYSENRTVLIDLTDPTSAFTDPATNYTWKNTADVNVTFEANDTLDPVLNWTVYADDVQDATGTVANATPYTHTITSLADGLHNATLQVWDSAYRYATNKTVWFYVDTTAPTVSLNTPLNDTNTTSTSLDFNWTASDNLDSSLTCDLYVDGALNQSGFETPTGSTNQTTISGFSDGLHNWSVSCTDEATNTDTSATYVFRVDTTAPTVNLEAPANQTLFSLTRDVTLSYNVTDATLPVDTCSLYVDDTLNQTNITVTEGTTQTFDLFGLPNAVYTWNVACNDTVGNAANSSQRQFRVNVSVYPTSPANATVVDRDSFSADPDSITLEAQVGDNASGVSVDFYANLTTPSISGQSDLLLGTNTTNASGTAQLTFDPDSTYYAGNYSWRPSADGYENETPRTFYVYGTPGVAFQDASFDPDDEYNASQTVTLNASVSSTPENASQLDTLYGLYVNATLTRPDASKQYVQLTGQGVLSGDHALPGDAQIGVWDALYNTSASWMYMNTTASTTRNFTVKGPANTVSPANGTVVDRDAAGPDPETITLEIQIPGATSGETVNFTADLTDPAFSDTGIVLGQNTTNASGHAVLTYDPSSARYAGTYQWYAMSSVSFVNQTSTFVIKGGAHLVRSDQDDHPLSGYNQTDTASFHTNITSIKESQQELGSNYTLTTNATVMPNFTASPVYTPTLTYDGQNWTGTQAIGYTDPVGTWKFVANTSGPYTYQNQSVEYYFTVYGLSNLSLADDTDTQTRRVYELVNFTANYTDTSNDTITGAACEIRYDLTSGWTAYESMAYDSTSGLYWHNRTFNETYSDAQFNVYCDQALYDDQNATSTFTINRTAAHMHTPPGQVVDRDSRAADPDTLLLNASMPQAPAGVNITFYTDLASPALGQTQLLIGSALTDASGHATTTWDPGSAVYAGNHTLYANSTYADAGNQSDAEVFGGLDTVFASATQNPDANYTQNATAQVHANATTSPESSADLNASYALTYNAYLQSSNGQDSTTLSFANPNWQGSYTLLTLGGVGVWNVSANASAAYHYVNSTNRTFEVYGYMNATDSTLAPTTHFVYASTTHECRVQDQHTAVDVAGASVDFYRNSTLVGSNTTNSSGWAQLTFQTNTSGSFDVTCQVEDQPGIYYYAGDDANTTDSLTVLPYPITPVSPANGTQVDRDAGSGSIPDTITLNVSVPSYVPDGLTITFTSNLSDPLTQGAATLGTNTTSGGYAVLHYDPNSTSYAGNHTWYANSADGAANGTRIYTSIATPSLSYWESLTFPDTNYTQNATAQFRYNLTTPGAETRDDLNASYASAVDYTLTSSSGTASNALAYASPYWNDSYALLGLGGVGVWNVSANSTGDYQLNASASARNFTVYGYMNATDITPANQTIYEYQYATQTCRVQDQHTAVDVQGASVNFYRNGTFLGSNTTNTSGETSITFQTNTSGTYSVTCNVTDQLSIYYYAGDDPDQVTTLTVDPFPVTPTSPANGTQVDRDGVTPTQDVILLNASVPSEIPAGVSISFYANLTDPAIPGQTELLLGTNTTTADQWAALTYDPNSSTYVGNYTWYAQGGSGGPNGTRTFIQTGGFNVSFANGTSNPNSEYDKPVNVTIDAVLQSYGPENQTVLDADYSAAVNNTFTIPNGTTPTISLAYNTINFSGQYEILIPDPRGFWTASLNASAQYLTLVGASSRQFFVNNYPPTHDNPVLNSTTVLNSTNETLTSYPQNIFDAEGDSTTAITDWRVGATSIAVLHMPFDSNVNSTAADAVRDYSSYENNATLGAGVASRAPTWTSSGPRAGAYDFDGVDDYIRVGGPAGTYDVSGPMSVCTTFNADSFTGFCDAVVSKGNSQYLFEVCDDGGRYFMFTTEDTGGNIAVTRSDAPVTPGTTYHVCGVFDGTQQRLYVNGTQQADVDAQNALNTGADDLVIGMNSENGGDEFNGTIDEVQIYNRSLSAQQVAQLYQEVASGSVTASLVDEETNKDEEWESCVTPNDGLDDGTTKCSNTVQVRGLVRTSAPANGTVVDRDSAAADPDAINLTADAFEDPGVNVSFYANLTEPSVAGQQDLLLGSALTNATGFATLSFDPDSSFFAGNYTWWPTASNATTLDARTFIVKGGLNTSLQSSTDPDAEYNKTQTVRVNATLSTVGPESPANLSSLYATSYNATLTPNSTASSTISLGFISGFWSGTYVLPVNAELGNWSTSLNASAQYFYTNSSLERDFTVYGLMNVTNATISPDPIYVYGSTTQQCRVQDSDNASPVASATVSFYRNSTFVGSNTTNSSGWAQLTFATNSTGDYVVNCNVTDQPGIYYYAGPQPQQNTTLSVLPYPITPVSPANGTQVDRDGVDATTPDTILLNVSVPSYVPDGENITFSSNLTDPLTQAAVSLGTATTSGGYAALSFDPNATSYAGNHTWYADSADGAPNGTRVYTSVGSLGLGYWDSSMFPDANYTQNQSAQLRFNLTTPGPETRDELNESYLGLVNFTLASSNGNDTNVTAYVSPYWQGSYSLLSLAGVGVWNVSAAADADYAFNTSVQDRNFTVYGYMNVTQSSLTPSSHFVYDSATHECRVQDQHTAVAVNGASVDFYRNSTLVGSNTTNSSGWAQYTFATNSSGGYDVTCQVEDQLGIYYYAGDAPNSTDSLTVLPYPITPVSPVNATQVDRDAGSGSIPDTITLNVSVPSYVPDGVNITFRANRTAPTTSSEVIGSALTSSSNAVLVYDPNATSFAGNYTWYANSDSGTPNGSRTYVSLGSLALTYWDDASYPDANYTQNQSAQLRFNLTSPGPETRAQINATYLAQVNYSLSGPGPYSNQTQFVDPYWSDSIILLSLADVGVYNITSESTADFFIPDVDTTRNFTVYGLMNVTDSTLSPSTTYVYVDTTQECRVQNQETGGPVQNASVDFYRNSTLIGSNTTNSSGWAQLTFTTNTSGIYGVTCQVEDQPGIYYLAGADANNTDALTVAPYPVTPVSPANSTQVDRDGVDAATPDTITLNVSVPGYVPDGENLTFYGNLTLPTSGARVDFGTALTNEGYATLTYDPAATLRGGEYVWSAETTSDPGGANGTRAFENFIGLSLEYGDSSSLPAANYTQNQTAQLRYNLTTVGPETRDELNASYGASVNFTLASSNGNDTNATQYSSPYWQGSYSLLSLAGVGVWNVSAAADADYAFNTSIQGRNFTVYGYMNTTSISVTPDPSPVFDNVSVQCRVQDQHTGVAVQAAQVEFLLDGTSQANASTNSTGWASAQFPIDTQGAHNVTCEVDTQLGIYYYAGDEDNLTASVDVIPYQVDASAPANGTVVDRDGVSADPDVIRLEAQARSSIPAGRNFTFFANLTDPALGQTDVALGVNQSNSSGAAVFYYDPNATTYAGNWTWWAQDTGAGVANQTRTFISKAAANVTRAVSDDHPLAAYNQTDNATFWFNVTGVLASQDELGFNYSLSTSVNFTPNASEPGYDVSLAYGTGNWSGGQLIGLTDYVGVWNVTARTAGPYTYQALSETSHLTVYGLSNLSLRDDSDTQVVRMYQDARFYANYTDTADASINYTDTMCLIRFDTNGTYGGYTNMSFDAGLDEWRYNTNFSDHGNYTYNVYCDDPLYDDQNVTDWFIINKTVVNSLSPANGTRIDRDNVSADNDSVTLVLNIPFAVQGINVTFALDLIDPDLNVTNVTIGHNLTQAGGNVTLHFDPDSTVHAGVQEYYGYAENADPNRTRNVHVYGSLDASYAGAANPDAEYNQTDTVLLDADATSLGPENASALNTSYNLTFTSVLTKPSSANVTSNLSFISPGWMGSYAIGASDEVGVWNTSAWLRARFFYNHSEELRNFTVYGVSNLTALDEQDVTPQTVFAGTPVKHYANWTHLDGSPVSGGACTLTLYNGTNRSMVFNGSVWSANASYPFAGIFRYNTSCDREYYYPVADQDNVSIATNVSLVAHHESVPSGERTYAFALSVTNQQNHTEGNVSLFTVIPDSLTPSYSDAPTSTASVSGAYPGTRVEWNWDNLTAYETKTVRLNVTGSGDWSLRELVGVTTPPISAEVFG